MFIQQSTKELEPFVDKINEAMLRETLQYGVGYLHEGLTPTDEDVVRTLFETGWIQVCVVSSSMCWGLPLRAHLVIIMGTQFRKEYYKKFLHEALPVESHLQHFLHDNLNAEVAVRVVTSKQDAVDYLTWTFHVQKAYSEFKLYYSLQGVIERHLCDHLSELVENTLSDLETSKCVAIEDDLYLSPLHLGLIASYYYINYTTMERFSSITVKTKLKGLLEILASAASWIGKNLKKLYLAIKGREWH